jgi:hypothetical protein
MGVESLRECPLPEKRLVQLVINVGIRHCEATLLLTPE